MSIKSLTRGARIKHFSWCGHSFIWKCVVRSLNKALDTLTIWQNIDRKLQINAQENSSWALSDPRNHTTQSVHMEMLFSNEIELSSKNWKLAFHFFQLAILVIRTLKKWKEFLVRFVKLNKINRNFCFTVLQRSYTDPKEITSSCQSTSDSNANDLNESQLSFFQLLSHTNERHIHSTQSTLLGRLGDKTLFLHLAIRLLLFSGKWLRKTPKPAL